MGRDGVSLRARLAPSVVVVLIGLGVALSGCRQPDRLPSTPYPKAKLAYRAGKCVYMDLNHAGEPEKSICFGDQADPMMAADFDGNGTTDLAIRRLGVVLIDTADDGESEEGVIDLGGVGDASGFLVADFSGSADRRGPAQICVIRGGRCRIQESAPGPGPDRLLLQGTEHFVGRWTPDGPARLGARTGNCVDLDEAGDGRPDKHLCYEDLGSIDQVLVGDWNGDGRDDLILRRGPCVFVDMKLDGTHTESQCLGENRATDYFVGSWDGK
jgi:hypothetical protein